MVQDFDSSNPALIEDPYPIYAEYRREDPVHYSETKRSWFVFGHELVTEAFRRHEALTAERTRADKHPGKPSRHRQIDQDGPNHRVLRNTLNTAFYPMVAKFGDRIEQVVATMSDELESSVDRFLDRSGDVAGEVDFVEHFAYPLPITAIADLMAIPENDRDMFEQWSHDLARAMDRFFVKGGFNFGTMRDYFKELVADRVANPGDDLISRLLAVEDFGEERMTEREVVEMSVAIIFAGHETTVNLLTNGTLALLSDESERQRFVADPVGLADSTVEELLRFDSPAQFIARAVLEPTELGGRQLKPGDALVQVIGSANRDETVFGEHADRLDIGRVPNLHIAFGVGRHFCPGSRLGRLEGRIAFPRLFQRFPDLHLGDTPPVRRPTAVFRGLETLPVVLN